jgi:hypothetical protein
LKKIIFCQKWENSKIYSRTLAVDVFVNSFLIILIKRELSTEGSNYVVVKENGLYHKMTSTEAL